jgi:hypothetical protein
VCRANPGGGRDGGTLRLVNTGIAIFEAASEDEAQRIVACQPVTRRGHMGGLRLFRLVWVPTTMSLPLTRSSLVREQS